MTRRGLLFRVAAAWGIQVADGRAASVGPPLAGWTKSPRNPILTLGNPGDFDSENIFAPAMARLGGRYLLFYSGGPAGPRNKQDYVRYQLGLAVSDDGEQFTKLGRPLLPLGDRDNFHCTPALLREPGGELLNKDGQFHLIYCANRADDVDHAVSDDGITWTKDTRSPIYRRAYAPAIVQAGDEFRMYFVHKPRGTAEQPGSWEIQLATGTDLYSLKPHPANPMLRISQLWEKSHLFYPYVIQEGDTWVMFYGAYWSKHPKAPTATAIGMATSRDGLHWTKLESNPVLTPTPGSSYDSIYTSSQSIIRDGDHYKMYYGARVDMVHKYYSIGLAVHPRPLT